MELPMTVTITILAARRKAALHELAKLTRRAAKHGFSVEVEESGARLESRQQESWDGERRNVLVEVLDLTLNGDVFRVGNYRFVAKTEVLEGARITYAAPGAPEIDPRFRECGSECEHCRTKRQRNITYIVADRATGAQMQVGSTCLKDFMGISPAAVAGRFAFFKAVKDLDGGLDGAFARAFSREEFIKAAVCAVRVYGWCSKGEAHFRADLRPTAVIARMVCNRDPGVTYGSADEIMIRKVREAMQRDDGETVAKIIKWASTLDAATDYEHNLKAVMLAEVWGDRHLGIAASAVPSWHRVAEETLKRQHDSAGVPEHVGAVGERMRGVEARFAGAKALGVCAYSGRDKMLVKFTVEGNAVKWFTTAWDAEMEVGESAVLDFTVKAHGEWNGAKETTVSRVSVK